MSKIGPKTFELLNKIEHPPSPHDMRNVCCALIRDNEIDAARELADTMLDHFTLLPSEVGLDGFYYWFGVSRTMSALADAKFDHWRRSDRKPMFGGQSIKRGAS